MVFRLRGEADLPLDPEAPRQRLGQIMADARSQVCLTNLLAAAAYRPPDHPGAVRLCQSLDAETPKDVEETMQERHGR
ncbi:hypothetical protein J7F01_40040 [Streptomyces sp. ISL-22]|uniref:hypothetical protein n=1 Tax=unclassified Streptomyces TaxID=2593676 RepID=UPI001BEB6FFA|nr:MULTISPECIES: hypothetical protein [unclassified Streptomyces]MBT2417535.1 hypothetical protein [Streptomyces sp. ISL-24]MBT2438211.1 hypothetical protein [Streptomyces sp. ISL-22]